MPYAIRHGSGKKPWKIVNKDTGKQVGSSKTKTKAQASVRARYAGKNEKQKETSFNYTGVRFNHLGTDIFLGTLSFGMGSIS